MTFTTIGLDYSTTAPTLTGVWLHAVTDPGGTEGNYLYQSSERAESLEATGVALHFIGRTYPVAEFGTDESQSLSLSVTIPFDDSHDAAVQALRVLVRTRATVCYRDNRQRLMFGAILGQLDINDSRSGSAAKIDLTRVDYIEGVPFSAGG